jgi:Leucine-rich repeat (LRR) protein
LQELYTYSRESRLLTPGYHLDYIPDLMLEAATSVTALSLDENNITLLPEEIGNFTLLTELFSVCDNALTAIPPCVGNMTKLTCLRLSGNSLLDLPNELSSMVLLRTLLVDHNSLSEMNRCFSTMTCLQVLSFVDNKIREVHPEFGLISSITSLRMHENPIVLPGPEIIDRPTAQVIDYLGRIKVSQFTGYLDLADLELQSLIHQLHDAHEAKGINLARNHLTSLPQDFGKFQRCQELILDGNPMPYLEEVVGKIKTLQMLSVERMKEPLRALPENTFGGLRALVVLRAAHNTIAVLPDVFKYLVHMEFLDLTSNVLSWLPPSLMHCKKLRVMLVSRNKLTELVKGFSNFHDLHTLDVSHNKLERLSRGMGRLVTFYKLKNHDLSNNPWVMPPPEIQEQGERKMLEYVGNLWRAKLDHSTKMMHYKLTEIHSEILQDNLVELNLDFNLISVIPLEIGRLKKLEDFSIIKNRLTELPDALFDLKQLRSLKVDDNKIAEIPRAIIRLSRSLETLSIYRNPIRFFPGELASLEMLTIINATPLGLDADLKQMFNAGFDTFIAYMKAWSTVQSTRKLQLNWNANAAWDPAHIFKSTLYIDFFLVNAPGH